MSCQHDTSCLGDCSRPKPANSRDFTSCGESNFDESRAVVMVVAARWDDTTARIRGLLAEALQLAELCEMVET